jgi:hypothetical protein
MFGADKVMLTAFRFPKRTLHDAPSSYGEQGEQQATSLLTLAVSRTAASGRDLVCKPQAIAMDSLYHSVRKK